MGDFHTIEADGIRMTLDLRVGHVRDLAVTVEGRDLRPFHTAPWVDDRVITEDQSLPGNLRFLSGDFFCAPFAASDVEAAPPHGWPANSPWSHVETTIEPGGTTAVYRLTRAVMGATLEKHLTLRDRHPFLYETHVFTDGAGEIPVANHAMTRFSSSGHLAFSPKRWIETPATPLESDPARGRSLLRYPARTEDPRRVPMQDGGLADITRYPIAERHEDFVTLVERPENALGWLAASRPASRDVMLSLKDPREFPLTFLWFSNGGRDYPPWNGRHTGVLGVEEARAFSVHGHRASIEPNAFSRAGIPTSLPLRPGGRQAVRNVVGAIPLPASGAMVTGIAPGDAHIVVTYEDGSLFTVPFWSDFFERP